MEEPGLTRLLCSWSLSWFSAVCGIRSLLSCSQLSRHKTSRAYLSHRIVQNSKLPSSSQIAVHQSSSERLGTSSMQRAALFCAFLLLGFVVGAAQTSGTAGTQGPTANGSAGTSANTSSDQSSNTTSGKSATGANQGSTSQTGATGTSGNTSAVGSSSANPSSPGSNRQSSTGSGANNAYPIDQNSAAGNNQMGAQAQATGASTGVGVSAKPERNKKKKSNANDNSAVPR
jgi:hypothetical protein